MARKALLVGINNYKGIGDLMGCVNDITNMRDILKRFLGFRNEEIRLLADSRATKNNILARLNWLVRGARAGDLLVFHFSGHGSQVRDRDGDELSDRMDEIICPYDMNWDGGYITDDDLNGIFRRLPQGVQLEVFLDCCHSGTGLRAADLTRSPDLGLEPVVAAYRRARYLPPPVDVLARVEGEEEELKPTRRFVDAARPAAQPALWAACRADQTSADAYIKGSYNGAFTYYLCRQMREANGTISRIELLRRVRQSLTHAGFAQTPRLEMDATLRNAKAFAWYDRKADSRAARRPARPAVTSNGKKTAPAGPRRATTLSLAK